MFFSVLECFGGVASSLPIGYLIGSVLAWSHCRVRKVYIMANGTVKWFNDRKGYGFVTTEDGVDAFAHYNEIIGDGYKTLDEGQEVTFEVEEADKGLKATKIEKV